MIKQTSRKIVQIGRAMVLFVGLAVVLGATLGAATTALAGTGVGETFNIGKKNAVNRISSLVGRTSGTLLKVDNNGTGPAVSLDSSAGQAPLTVNPDAGTATNLSADELDGKDSSQFANYRRTVVVSPTGTPVQNGNALKNALSGISGASETTPYLLKIEPGVYDLGAAPGLVMKPWVDVEGSGEGVTTLTATGGLSWADATVQAASNSELRFLTVKNTGGADKAFAIHSTANPFRLTHVSAAASGGASYSRAVVIDSGATTLSGVSATASGNTSNLGVFVSGRVTMDQVTVDASGGSNIGVALQGDSSLAQIRNSRIAVSSGITINNFGSARLGASQLEGGTVSNATANGATIKCVASYNANYDPLGTGCT